MRDERRRLVELWEQGWRPSDLARYFEVSRPTVYTTIERWLEEGEGGLEDRSRRPLSNRRQTSSKVMAALLTMKDAHPRWGPDKLVRLLRDEGIELSASTARDILRRHGKVEARRARPVRWSPLRTPSIVVPSTGHSMTADYKGQFRLGNGKYCYPLTIADPASRYVFAIEAFDNTRVLGALKVFERVFREWGMPEQVITDNGVPFCAPRSIGGLTELSKMWIKLGIQHVRIEPGRPQQNGSHERMHRTLKDEATKPPKQTRNAQQRRFNVFREEFNQVRPHQALGQERPAAFVERYRRSYPARMPAIEYPNSFEIRTVRSQGVIKWRGDLVFVGEVLIGERVGLARLDDDCWHLYFGPARLATWNDRTSRLEPPKPNEPIQRPPSADTPSSVLPLEGEEDVKDVSVDV